MVTTDPVANLAFVAWMNVFPDDQLTLVAAQDELGAVVAACEELGYGVRELAEERLDPWSAVTVLRAPSLDALVQEHGTEAVCYVDDDDLEEAAGDTWIKAIETNKKHVALQQRMIAESKKPR